MRPLPRGAAWQPSRPIDECHRVQGTGPSPSESPSERRMAHLKVRLVAADEAIRSPHRPWDRLELQAIDIVHRHQRRRVRILRGAHACIQNPLQKPSEGSFRRLCDCPASWEVGQGTHNCSPPASRLPPRHRHRHRRLRSRPTRSSQQRWQILPIYRRRKICQIFTCWAKIFCRYSSSCFTRSSLSLRCPNAIR